MRIVRAYTHADWENKQDWHRESPLMKKIRESYDLTEIRLEDDYREEDYAEILRQYDVVLTMWSSPRVPEEMAHNPGKLKYICNISGGVAGVVSSTIVDSPYLTVTNWGDAPAFSVAEGAFALMQAVMKDIPLAIEHVKNGGLGDYPHRRSASLHLTRVGIYGMGVIGRKFIDFIRPYMPEMYAYDPYVDEMPEGVTKLDSLEDLFSKSQILVIHAALCAETEGSVTKELLAMLPNGGIIINTARGRIVDQEALFKELGTGRLRAGIDVMYPKDWPEKDSPVRQWKNVIFTGHFASAGGWEDDPNEYGFADINCLENLRRFCNAEPLKFIMDTVRYKRST